MFYLRSANILITHELYWVTGRRLCFERCVGGTNFLPRSMIQVVDLQGTRTVADGNKKFAFILSLSLDG